MPTKFVRSDFGNRLIEALGITDPLLRLTVTIEPNNIVTADATFLVAGEQGEAAIELLKRYDVTLVERD